MVKKVAIAAFIANCDKDRWCPATVVSQLQAFCDGDLESLHVNCQPLIDGSVAHPEEAVVAG